MMVKGKRVKNNALFRKDERYFYRNVNRSESRAGKIPNIDQFVAFWGGLWETDKVTPSLPWMEEVAGKLKRMSIEVKEFDLTEEKLTEIIKKRKNWSSPGIDGIQNYWWKKFKPAQQALCRALRRIKENHYVGRYEESALVGSPPSDSVTIKTLEMANPISTNPHL